MAATVQNEHEDIGQRVRIGILLVVLQVYHLFNATLSLAIFIIGIVVMLPLMFGVWVLSLFSGLPGIPKIIGVLGF